METLILRYTPSDMSHCDHRVWLELNGPELHIYNRSQLYSKLEKTFGLEQLLMSGGGKTGKTDEEAEIEVAQTQAKDMSFWQDWRDLIPVIKIDLNMVSWIRGYFVLFLHSL